MDHVSLQPLMFDNLKWCLCLRLFRTCSEWDLDTSFVGYLENPQERLMQVQSDINLVVFVLFKVLFMEENISHKEYAL